MTASPPVVREPRGLPPGLGLPLALLAHLAVGALRRLRGYTRPGSDPIRDVSAAVDYDQRVVERWLGWLERHRGGEVDLRGLHVLELGPGPDLGAGLVFLARGVARYTAADANPLATRADARFYARLLDALALDAPSRAEIERQLALWRDGRGDRLRFVCQPDFDLAPLAPGSFDLVVSQAAFEHFDDPARTLGQLGRVVRPGGWLVAQVDLKTHTPGLRGRDPLGIYRIPDWLYRRTPYPGVPNRARPLRYVESLRAAGWRDVRLEVLEVASERYLAGARRGLARRFRRPDSQMEVLSFAVCATRGSGDRGDADRPTAARPLPDGDWF